MDIKIVVAAHKLCGTLPADPPYVPVQAGRALNGPLPYTGDDTGDNISRKNGSFCELTALYWAWKNLPADALGLVHYRRYLTPETDRHRPLDRSEAQSLLEECDVLLPRKRRYYIETTYSQYAHAHHAADLRATRRVIADRCPAYLPYFDENMRASAGHRFNMFVMRRPLADAWCRWLFDILFALEQTLDISDYEKNDRRVFGFVSERLLDVWLDANGLACRELPVWHTESQHWLKKGTSFVRRKMLGEHA